MTRSAAAGQNALETLMAVLVIMGIFLVVSMISAQRSEVNNFIIERDQNAALCDRISLAISKVDSIGGNARYGFWVNRQARIENGTINFGGLNGYYCYYLGVVQGESSPGILLSAGTYYHLIKDSNQIRIQAGLPPP